MDAVVKKLQTSKDSGALSEKDVTTRPSREEAEEAVRVLIRWAGDDPAREGLLETPKRVIKAYQEYFSGYDQDPAEVLKKTFLEVEGYDDIVVVRDINIESHCEHHMAAIIGKAHVAYLPDGKVVGISKLARLVEIFSKRLQTQETMTVQIADAIEEHLKPRGVAVLIDALHGCMTTRGVKKIHSSTVTTQFRGIFAEDPRMETRFFAMIGQSED